jgi:competence ComEA-like helix-hairpin-helix protein
MALFSFGRKEKNPPEVPAPVAKTLANPPKIQTPPGSGTFPAVKPPQPTGLMPSSPMSAGAATTQPMVMPRTGATGLKTVRPGLSGPTRSTQRIVLPTPPGGKTATTTKPLNATGGRINLPIGMILRCLPPEVLAEDISTFEANGTAATEVGLPMNMILGQLPSGKVEMALQDLIPHFPAGYLQPTESITNYLPNLISLPLMDVVMRIPPDLLALRPDQKDVDASVINMADPFTEEILREQAEAARKAAAQTNIIEESQAPQEEFVPSAEQAGPIKAVVPPRRPNAEPLIPTRGSNALTATTPPPMPPVARVPSASPSGGLGGGVGGLKPPPPVSPTPGVRSIPQPSSSMVSPMRPTTLLPSRPQAPVTMSFDTPTVTASTPPVPPVPRNTGAIPAPPPPKHTTSVQLQRRTGALPPFGSTAPMPPVAPTPAAPEPPAEAPAATPPASDDLQRLAALAMEQLGDDEAPATEEPAAVEDSTPKPEAPAPEPAAAAPASIASPTPAVPRTPSFSTPPAPPLPKPPLAAPTHAAEPEPVAEASATAGMAFNLNTCTPDDLVKNIPGCSADLAASIVEYRNKIGTFKKLEELLDVPGITRAAYTNLTGEAPPENRMMLTLNELLGFPGDQSVSLKDVTERIACWPDVTGCVLSQSTGLSLVGTVPEGVNKEAIVAFAPRMFDAINKSFHEVSGQETDALVIPSTGTSFHLFRNKNLYLIIMSRLPQMPERHVKVARYVLAALSIRKL